MPKRKQSDDKEATTKKPKNTSDSEGNNSKISHEKTSLTKQNKRKENIPWPDDDLLELISKIEENIPNDDGLMYSTRLERVDWENITFKAHSVEECQKVWSVLLKQVRKFRLLKEIVNDMKEWVRTPNNQQKENVCHHPDKPKQPRNSYLLFAREKRQEVMDEYPELPPPEISRKLGQMFKNLSEKEKQKYSEEARIARQQYSEDLQNFYEQHPEFIPKETNKKSKRLQLKEGTGPPEKPKTPFELFMKIEAEKNDDGAPKVAFNLKCRERWQDMDDKDKLFWINWAEEQYNKYLMDLKEYIKIHPQYEADEIKNILTKKEKAIKERYSGKPQKPPHGPYQLFLKMMGQSEEVRKINNKDMMNYISEKWKACSEDEKNEYKIRVKQMWEEYEIKLNEYLKTLPPEDRDKVEEKERRKKNQKPQLKTQTVTVERAKVPLKKPELPPLTEYKYFLSVYKGKENPMVVWKSMTDEEKTVYEDELELKRRNYIALYEQYLKSLSPEELEKLGGSIDDRPYDTSTSSDSSENSEDSD